MQAGVTRVAGVDYESGPKPLYELQVELENGPVTDKWAELFRSATVAKAGDHTMMASDPVLVGTVVTWKVAQPSLPHAERVIRRRITWANERFYHEAARDHSDPPPRPERSRPDQREVDAVRLFLDRHRRAS